jgi:hypothetical protein
MMRAICLTLGLLLGAAASTATDAADATVPEERIIEQQLDTTQSRVLRDSDRPLERSQVTRDLGAAEQRLRSYETREPNAAATPLLERQLDRLSRPTDLRSR